MSETLGPAILEGGRVTPGDVARVGGKAVNLARLQHFGQTVPPWYAVTRTAVPDFNSEPSTLVADVVTCWPLTRSVTSPRPPSGIDVTTVPVAFT